MARKDGRSNSAAIAIATNKRKSAEAKPARSPTLPVPKLKRGLLAFRRAKAYAAAAMASAPACVAIWMPSASRAIELKATPATISPTIMTTVRSTTALVRRALSS